MVDTSTPAMASHTLATTYGLKCEFTSYCGPDMDQRFQYACGVPDDAHPYDLIFPDREMPVPSLLSDEDNASAPDDVRDEDDAWRAMIERARTDVWAGLPEGRAASLHELDGIGRAASEALLRCKEQHEAARDGIRDALAVLVPYGASLNEWEASRTVRPERYGWDTDRFPEVVRDPPSLGGLYHDVARTYEAAVTRPAERERITSWLQLLADVYRLPESALRAQWGGVRRHLAGLARVHEEAAEAEALRIAALSVASDVLAGAPRPQSIGLDPDGKTGTAAPLRPFILEALRSNLTLGLTVEKGKWVDLAHAWQAACERHPEGRAYLATLEKNRHPVALSPETVKDHYDAAVDNLPKVG